MVQLNRPDPDAPLVSRVGAGDEGAARQLIGAKLPRVLTLATRLLGDRAEAEDVAQETFVRLWRHAARWQPGTALFDTWLHMVTLNLCRDRLRRKRERVTSDPPDRPDPAPTPEAALDEAQRADAVATAIRALPERQREAILLVHYQDLTNIEAAALLGVSVDALESLLARGRRALRKAFEERDHD